MIGAIIMRKSCPVFQVIAWYRVSHSDSPYPILDRPDKSVDNQLIVDLLNIQKFIIRAMHPRDL